MTMTAAAAVQQHLHCTMVVLSHKDRQQLPRFSSTRQPETWVRRCLHLILSVFNPFSIKTGAE
ncbi:hypothetical protein E2C01_010818 [Portunus trituberculatus]|uniref:Uncharacterized protein n=1 Tax=Portunus trituberculatus TaxID=210409 RepID=A0A5B7D9M4_PORTR|nr:hypothetical protein [Portunus trituberculatus]